ncbi:NADH dehydrogenase [ubiquinone] 1 alpha subcomplex subunit 9 [Trichinella spiralis]|uniref:NADH dehydrogenase [ubiquinone] 1 alpha subcomplex subunit 9 n=1 Tax=Trichinella spiralis TaxID=6334 RepID=A0ABR3KWQ6_TRISP
MQYNIGRIHLRPNWAVKDFRKLWIVHQRAEDTDKIRRMFVCQECIMKCIIVEWYQTKRLSKTDEKDLFI